MYFEFWGLLPQERTVNLHKWKFSQRDNLPIFDEETLIGKYLAKSHMFYHPAWLFRVGKKIECSSLRSFLPQNENYFDKTKLRGTSTRSGRHTLFCYKKQDSLLMKLFSADWTAGKVIFSNPLCLYGSVIQVYGDAGLGFVYGVITLTLLRLACGRTVKS